MHIYKYTHILLSPPIPPHTHAHTHAHTHTISYTYSVDLIPHILTDDNSNLSGYGENATDVEIHTQVS